MSLDLSAHLTATAEARRQIEICNACRYCEGFCAVFPAMTREKAFADGDLTHLANLCHNCRGCYYSCQYTEPHEFALNIPAALAEVRQESWERLVGPAAFSRAFHENGVAMAGAMVLGIAALFGLIATLPEGEGAGFYAFMSHNAMVALFLPAFLLPLAAVGVGVGRYWREVGAGRATLGDLTAALLAAGRMKNLSGGQGQGCNFEREDRYSDARRHCHQAVMWGFLLCFAATSTATLMHYLLAWPAPYPPLSPPKLLGVPGGVLMVAGALGLVWLKTRADRALGAARVWGGEMAFILLLAFVAASGLALYAVSGTAAVPVLLALHLGSVLTLFLLLPYTKMVHGFFRLAALVAEEAMKRRTPVSSGGE
ncbi:tricarballylate utilization 4Fe-4S protein TcuB [Arvimicrobium flavum]|uniref:tricarballylate utilization 4Fe-4S protein TcuB n=1 Tax=Arvimicrobium flavum TaxID=3393320 RepID=UPI00237C02CE|nr:tricarballylate utilization 4Fe-4S protein TcuB [Mesorhizobium shangrilense]